VPEDLCCRWPSLFLPIVTKVLASSTRGAIGYVSGAANSERVKILAVVRQGHEQERRLLKRVEPEYPETLKRLSERAL